MSVSDPRRDPRFRPYRTGAYALYVSVVVAFCLLVIVSVVRSVRAMTPGRQPPAGRLLTVRECVDASEALWRDLERERELLVGLAGRTRDVDQAWMTFRTGWLARLRQEEARCAPHARERKPLAEVFRRLEQVLNLYTTQAVQYAGQVGPPVDKLQEAFRAARADPAAGRLP